MGNENIRHICGLSGGKDSAALAIYLRDKVPEMEYFFCDTGYELPEVYEFLNRLEAFLGKPIARLDNGGRTFEHYLVIYNNFLPSPASRWCTRHLKLEPMEKFISQDQAINYVAIRADENREGYTSKKPNITSCFPFIEDGLTLNDIHKILDSTSLGLPKYYEWRSRSGCFFCFYQRKIEWIRLYERHPDLFYKAMSFEKIDNDGSTRYTWNAKESLEELIQPERINQIKNEEEIQKSKADNKIKQNSSLLEIFSLED